ncbi:MarR family winged helix-turn-helix transcriptional regulator [Chromobacterium sp. IIBBL 290-4]|uniref:MarR family winged helix-turn-helix transcriptional regulator n=1 Tax=Chromobacterium sp. IIBBL 290-4 TaxID=2953890 RepID=UPI0020B6F723|nr:MarR family transcriptional regulator [Chromobacterium sp. IIBBL 290-4]UTH72791.1 MarR family transcriptional regulator [Chromobacterium sp. IIBBL 290-4]
MLPSSLLWERIRSVVDGIENRLAKNLQRDHGLGLSEYRALQYLAVAANSELRMQELAHLLGLNQSSVTRVAERLEKAGYTQRDLCPNDKRGVYTVLTEQGRKVQSLAGDDYALYIQAALDEAELNEENMQIVPCLRGLLSALPNSAKV